MIRLAGLFIFLMLSNSAFANPIYQCGYGDHFFIDFPSALNACLTAELNRNNPGNTSCPYSNDLSSPYGRATGYRCNNFTGGADFLVAEDLSRYDGKFVESDGRIRNYIDPNSCVAPDIYNSITDACEGDNSDTCLALEIYDSLSNSCLDAPVGYGCENGMTLLSSGNTTMDGCVENPPTCTAFAQTSFYGDSISLCQEQKIACESGGSEYSYGTVGTATGTQQLCYYHPEGYTSSCSDGSGLHLSIEDAENYALLCSDIDLPDDVCDPTRNDCDGDGQLDDTDKDGCLDNGVSNGTCIGSTNTGSSTSLIPEWQDPFGTAKLQTGRCDPTSIDYADCVGLTGSIDLTQTEDTLADILASLNGEGNENTITPSDSDTEASYFVARMNQVPIVAAMDGAFTFSGDPTCPAPTFDIFGQTFALNYHCTLYPTFSGMLSSLMLVLYSIYGIRHVMSA